MSLEEDKFEETYEKLKTMRDELQVKLDLGKKEVGEAWEELEDDWEKLDEKFQRLKEDGSKASEQIGEDARELVADVGDSLSKLRERFT